MDDDVIAAQGVGVHSDGKVIAPAAAVLGNGGQGVGVAAYSGGNRMGSGGLSSGIGHTSGVGFLHIVFRYGDGEGNVLAALLQVCQLGEKLCAHHVLGAGDGGSVQGHGKALPHEGGQGVNKAGVFNPGDGAGEGHSQFPGCLIEVQGAAGQILLHAEVLLHSRVDRGGHLGFLRLGELHLNLSRGFFSLGEDVCVHGGGPLESLAQQ